MRNTLKKKITKGFLLFLFTFFSVGVQAQWDEYGGSGGCNITDAMKTGPFVNGVNAYGVLKEFTGNAGQIDWETDPDDPNYVIAVFTIIPQYEYSCTSGWDPYASGGAYGPLTGGGSGESGGSGVYSAYATPTPAPCGALVCSGLLIDMPYIEPNYLTCKCDKLPRPWYLDKDGDGWHEKFDGVKTQIEAPSSLYKKTTLGEDCDDTLPDGKYAQAVCTKVTWVKDVDDDKYYVTGSELLKYNNWPPTTGYKKKENRVSGDCDDTNPIINKKINLKDLLNSNKANTKLLSGGRNESDTMLGNEEQSQYGGGDKPVRQPKNVKTFRETPDGYTLSVGNLLLRPFNIRKKTVNLLKMNDNQLVNFVSNTLHLPTITGTDASKSADIIVSHLQSKAGGIMYNPFLGPLINVSDGNTGSKLDDFFRTLQAALCTNKDKLVCQNEATSISNVIQPSFPNSNPVLKSQLGGTQGFSLEIDNNGNLQAYIYDTFGVDENDTTKESSLTTMLEQIGAIKGLRALWILQQQRGYKPFLMKTPLNLTIRNPQNGTITSRISLNNCN